MSGAFRFRLSKGSLLLLHLADMGHVWRDDCGEWVASTVHTKRKVDIRVKKMIYQGVLEAKYTDHFPRVTQLGRQYLQEHPLQDPLLVEEIR